MNYCWWPKTSGFPKDARKSIKAKKAALESLHLAKAGTEVATRMWQVWSQVLTIVMESK